MTKNYFLIVLSLLVSLFIYIFYRTEKTVINDIIISIVSCDDFVSWQKMVSGFLPLSEMIVYSLPEGLWVYCITLTSKYLFLKIGRQEVKLLFFPLICSIGLELFQLLHLTNGRFDVWDIAFSIFFWIAAVYPTYSEKSKQNIFDPFSIKSAVCVSSYLVVYLAHVCNY